MKRPGLTEARERALKRVHSGEKIRCRMFGQLLDDGLIEYAYMGGKLTPRGQAALAAPVSITAMQLQVLEWLEADYDILTTHINSFTACCHKGWVNEDGSALSDAGTTALNNIRAASGSPEWKEVP